MFKIRIMKVMKMMMLIEDTEQILTCITLHGTWIRQSRGPRHTNCGPGRDPLVKNH
jgi:hypothetical protein